MMLILSLLLGAFSVQAAGSSGQSTMQWKLVPTIDCYANQGCCINHPEHIESLLKEVCEAHPGAYTRLFSSNPKNRKRLGGLYQDAETAEAALKELWRASGLPGNELWLMLSPRSGGLIIVYEEYVKKILDANPRDQETVNLLAARVAVLLKSNVKAAQTYFRLRVRASQLYAAMVRLVEMAGSVAKKDDDVSDDDVEEESDSEWSDASDGSESKQE